MYNLNQIIQKFENQKPYCSPDFSIKKFAIKLGIPSHQLLTFLNNHYGISFFKKLSQLRVSEAKNLLKTKENQKLPLTEICDRSGFKSMAHFRREFTSQTNMSPFQYKISHNKILEPYINIGVLLDNFYDNYNAQIFKGIKAQSIKYENINIFCFLGGSIDSPYYNYKDRNFIFDYATHRHIDGIISLTSSLSMFITYDKLNDFFKKKYVPIVSIGKKIKDHINIHSDMKSGMKELMNHLIVQHKCKRFAFITGPKSSDDANLRLKIFKESLQENNIPINNDLIIEGNFLKHSGSNAVDKLYNQGKINIDAIVAANDYMAIAAIRRLQYYGIDVPNDIIVTGFDNIGWARYSNIPLTTITQNEFEIGSKSLDLIIAKIEDNKTPNVTELQSKLILRKSCGCTSMTSDLTDDEIGFKNIEKIYQNYFPPKIFNFYTKTIKKLLKKKYTRMGMKIESFELSLFYLKIFYQTLINSSKPEKMTELKNKLGIYLQSRLHYHFCYDFIYYSYDIIIQELKNDEASIFYNNMLNFIYQNENSPKEYSVYNSYEYLKKIYHHNQDLLKSTEIEKIFLSNMPYYGINSFCISLFANEQKKSNNQLIKVLMNYNIDYQSALQKKYDYFPANEIIPGGLRSIKKRGVYIIMPMLYRNEALGIALFECDLDEYILFEIILTQLSNSVKHFDLIKYLENNKYKEKAESKIKRMDEKRAEYYYEKLISLFQKEKPYLNPELDLDKVSVILNISRNDLSYIINKYTSYNFNDFINSYRIEEIKNILINHQYMNYNMLDLAFDAGFNSKPTFNRVFKKFTNQTPTEFIKKYLLKS